MDAHGNKDEPGSDDEFPGLDLSVIIQPLLDQGYNLKEIAVSLRKTVARGKEPRKFEG